MRYLCAIAIVLFLCFTGIQLTAQQLPQTPSISNQDTVPAISQDSVAVTSQDTVPVTSLNPELLNIFNQTAPKKYKVTAISVTGNNYFDQNLLLSIAGLNV